MISKYLLEHDYSRVYGYNPYHTVLTVNGVKNMGLCTELELLQTLTYLCLKNIRNKVALKELPTFLFPYPWENLHIQGLLMELYLRAELPGKILVHSGSVEWDTPEDILEARRILGIQFPEFVSYSTIQDRTLIPYENMDTQHLLNAFFANARIELEEPTFDQLQKIFNFEVLRYDAEIDGLFTYLEKYKNF